MAASKTVSMESRESVVREEPAYPSKGPESGLVVLPWVLVAVASAGAFVGLSLLSADQDADVLACLAAHRRVDEAGGALVVAVVGTAAVAWQRGRAARRTFRALLSETRRRIASETEVQLRERRLAAVLQQVPMALFIVDHEGRPFFANDAATQLLGKGLDPTATNERRPEVYQTYVEGTDRLYPAARMPLARALAGEERVSVEDLELKVGERRIPLDVWANPVRDPDGKVAFALAAFRDATPNREALSNRLAAETGRMKVEHLEEVDRLKGQFVNMAAHELGAPLSAVTIQLYLLRNGPPPPSPEQVRALDLLDRNVERLIGLVQDILDGARLQSGRFTIRPTRVDIGSLAADAATSFRPVAQQSGIEVDAKVGSLPLWCEADPDRITQVLINFLNNAKKFTPPGGRITVEASEANGLAVVAVRDTGAGIEPAALSRLFQPFSQVHDPAKLKVGGTGLGLYICKGIVEQHGGSVRAESAGPGRGATFAVELPTMTSNARV